MNLELVSKGGAARSADDWADPRFFLLANPTNKLFLSWGDNLSLVLST